VTEEFLSASAFNPPQEVDEDPDVDDPEGDLREGSTAAAAAALMTHCS
jgi:hypothetical protein